MGRKSAIPSFPVSIPVSGNNPVGGIAEPEGFVIESIEVVIKVPEAG